MENSPMRGRLQQLRALILIRAVEQSDEEGQLISFEARRQADQYLEGEEAGSPLQAMMRRAEVLCEQLGEVAPQLLHGVERISLPPQSLPLLCALFAFVLGFSAHEVENGARFHIVSLNFWGLIFWNLFSLFALLVFSLLKCNQGTSYSTR